MYPWHSFNIDQTISVFPIGISIFLSLNSSTIESTWSSFITSFLSLNYFLNTSISITVLLANLFIALIASCERYWVVIVPGQKCMCVCVCVCVCVFVCVCVCVCELLYIVNDLLCYRQLCKEIRGTANQGILHTAPTTSRIVFRSHLQFCGFCGFLHRLHQFQLVHSQI